MHELNDTPDSSGEDFTRGIPDEAGTPEPGSGPENYLVAPSPGEVKKPEPPVSIQEIFASHPDTPIGIGTAITPREANHPAYDLTDDLDVPDEPPSQAQTGDVPEHPEALDERTEQLWQRLGDVIGIIMAAAEDPAEEPTVEIIMPERLEPPDPPSDPGEFSSDDNRPLPLTQSDIAWKHNFRGTVEYPRVVSPGLPRTEEATEPYYGEVAKMYIPWRDSYDTTAVLHTTPNGAQVSALESDILAFYALDENGVPAEKPYAVVQGVEKVPPGFDRWVAYTTELYERSMGDEPIAAAEVPSAPEDKYRDFGGILGLSDTVDQTALREALEPLAGSAGLTSPFQAKWLQYAAEHGGTEPPEIVDIGKRGERLVRYPVGGDPTYVILPNNKLLSGNGNDIIERIRWVDGEGYMSLDEHSAQELGVLGRTPDSQDQGYLVIE